MANAQRQVVTENKRRNSQAFYYIQQGLEDSMFPNIGIVDHAKKSLDILEVAYQGNDKVKTTKLETLENVFKHSQ